MREVGCDAWSDPWEVVDGHEILRPLGAGGMGEVYVARGAGGALRALKVVRADDTAGSKARGAPERFTDLPYHRLLRPLPGQAPPARQPVTGGARAPPPQPLHYCV